LEILTNQEITKIIEQLESDDMAYVFSGLDENRKEQILSSIDKTDSIRIRTQLAFEENTAGRLMNLDFAFVKINETARRGIQSVRKAAKQTDDIYVIYVIDESGEVKGIVHLKDLLIVNPRTKIFNIMKPVKTIHYNTNQEEIANFFKKYDYFSAPVVDDEGKIIGRITIDDVLVIAEEEATKDMYQLGGVSEEESITSSIWNSVKHRLMWLNMNLFIAMATTSIVTLFEDTIQRIVILASLMPIVAGMGGNAGTQAITIVIRNMATGELSNARWFFTFRKELFIGLINGLTVGLVAFTVTLFIRQDFMISGIMGLAMFCNLSIAGLMGTMVPFFLKWIGIDPAVASSIFVTAFTDMFGFFCFLGLATIAIPG
jgi:magnesium transporter